MQISKCKPSTNLLKVKDMEILGKNTSQGKGR